ncbi:periplasmic binding protein/LacI transcriptional regulator [gut metagenome]|uniref:Periplasmic binding protein/LacI transcriptional regulator n=1 Tax=gut metagenome TaxID=749906 RepID=J9G0M7_9ZZZZ
MTHVGVTESSQKREMGFTDEITQNHPGIEIVNVSHENEESSMAELAKAVLTLYPDVKGYFCTNETATNSVLDVVNADEKKM